MRIALAIFSLLLAVIGCQAAPAHTGSYTPSIYFTDTTQSNYVWRVTGKNYSLTTGTNGVQNYPDTTNWPPPVAISAGLASTPLTGWTNGDVAITGQLNADGSYSCSGAVTNGATVSSLGNPSIR